MDRKRQTGEESEDGADGPGDDRPLPVDRRTLLRAVGTGALTAAAGCATRTRRYEAAPVRLASTDSQYRLASTSSSEITREHDIEGSTLEVTLKNELASYDHDGNTFVESVTVGLASTPSVTEAGISLNPITDMSVEELLTGDLGRAFLGQVDVGSGWQRGPRTVTTSEGTLFGMEVQFQVFAGITDEEEFALLNVVKVEHDGDVVLVGDARTKHAGPADDQFVGEDGHVTRVTVDASAAMFSSVLPQVVHGDGAGEEGSTAASDESLPPARIPMAEVPEDVRRRAVRFVERFASGNPRAWEEPTLGDYAHSISRPDVDGIAYYELELEPGGYVVCATGRHDAPFPNFGTRGRSIGRHLEAKADGTFANVVWIDPQRFVAEDPDGNRIAVRGNAVPKIEGLEALFESAGGIEHVVAGPGEDGPRTDEEVAEDYEPTVLEAENRFEPPEEVAFAEWESHDELKANYVDVYGPLLDAHREQAEEAWDVLEERGGVTPRLGAGTTHREPLFEGQSVEDVAGDPAALLDVQEIHRDVGHDLLEITPAEPPVESRTASVVLSDVDGAIRELDYLVESAAGRSSAGVAGSNTLSHGGNSHYAGGVAHQTWFEQHRYQGCPVGCGPVAWILLFGWGDMEAHYGLRGWGPRWGLYRKNGGKGADELIPDGTVSANLGGPRNVMEELNGYVDVWCPNSNNGATFPWDMNEAKAYFRGRTGTTLETHLNPTGSPCPRCKNEIVESIKGNDRRKEETPAVVGKGWLSHYPLAYGFYDGWHDFFKVNNGWGWDHDQRTEWIWAETWFSGEIHTYR